MVLCWFSKFHYGFVGLHSGFYGLEWFLRFRVVSRVESPVRCFMCVIDCIFFLVGFILRFSKGFF